MNLDTLLLIDACGETAGVAVSRGAEIVAQEELPRNGGSAGMVAAVGRVLHITGCTLRDLAAIGVVSGPGSFTGVRVGLSTAKGLCEAAGLPLVAVSRLEVLLDAASLTVGLAVLNAGRGEVYVREQGLECEAREWLGTFEGIERSADGQPVVVAEQAVAERLAGLHPVLRPLHACDALSAVLRGVARGAVDVAAVDAHYLRGQSDIYAKRNANAGTKPA